MHIGARTLEKRAYLMVSNDAVWRRVPFGGLDMKTFLSGVEYLRITPKNRRHSQTRKLHLFLKNARDRRNSNG